MKTALYFTAKDAFCDHLTDAPLVAIKNGHSGYFPIYSKAMPDDLNGFSASESLKQSALAGSMFGWRVPAAIEAVNYFSKD